MFSSSYPHPPPPPTTSTLPSQTEPRHHQANQTNQHPTTQSQPPQETSHPRVRQQSISATATRHVPHQQHPSTIQSTRQPSTNTPTCANCGTNTTPLWRRNQSGATLCNACALFQKMKGRPRPISLKTNVIKPRNRIKAIDRMPANPENKSSNTKNGGPRQLASGSGTTNTPLHPSPYHQQQHHPQRQIHQQPSSSRAHSSQNSPTSPIPLAIQPYRKPSSHYPASGKFLRPNAQPLSVSSAHNLPASSYGHSQSAPTVPSTLIRSDAHSSRKSLPGGPDPFSHPSSLTHPSAQPKRRKHSLAIATENTYPTSAAPLSGSPDHGKRNHLKPLPSANSLARLPAPNSRYSPPSLRHSRVSDHFQLSPTDDHVNRNNAFYPSKSQQAMADQGTSTTERVSGRCLSTVVLPPLSQLTRHLNENAEPLARVRTTELGPPKSFEESAREARLHSPVSPYNHRLAIPATVESRRALSVHSSISDPDSVLSPIRIASPTVHNNSSFTPPERLPRHQLLETPISPVSHHWPREAAGHDDSQAPLEEVCQLKKRIAELELLNGRMVSRLDQLERRPTSTPPPAVSPSPIPLQALENNRPEELDCSATDSDNEISINTTSFVDHCQSADTHLEEFDEEEDEEEEDMIDETY
ncbi:hypothetical protein PGT21_033327 [Puccinia graminis f. sp. tritici]|uniref:GATA-type domain-containing protein n=1 Tax=Puccinia graminis f. sp. tritici TaxID=56615 RepID=A0A5B0NUC3_PUCGR|nr:hypothetical protein PGTUg99_034822 [Puccinia graminis f. sp. tritici]KAA1091418.1 hypothetical protein PGT21_033327 [Puccinia graminis f. sp. tritici]